MLDSTDSCSVLTVDGIVCGGSTVGRAAETINNNNVKMVKMVILLSMILGWSFMCVDWCGKKRNFGYLRASF